MLRYLAFLLCLFLGLESAAKEKEYADEFFYEKVSEIREAQARNDFEALASCLHEQALAYYRRILLLEISALKKQYTDAEIQAVTGIDLGRMSLFTDSEFFIAFSQSVLSGPGGVEMVTYLGVVRDGSEVTHVLYRYEAKNGRDGDEITVLRPMVLTFRRAGNDVKLWSIILANSFVRELRSRLELLMAEAKALAVDELPIR